MFLESAKEAGWIEVICGSMFSGKTEELMCAILQMRWSLTMPMPFNPHLWSIREIFCSSLLMWMLLA